MAHRATVVQADFEVTVQRGTGETLLHAGLFVNEDGTVDFGFGWDGETEIDGIRAILESTALGVSSMYAWVDAATLRSENERAKGLGDELPHAE